MTLLSRFVTVFGLLALAGCGDPSATRDPVETAPVSQTIQVTSNSSDQQPPVGRLTDLARPTAYLLDLTIDPREQSFGGNVLIDLELARETSVIWLHGRDLRVSSTRATLADGSVHQGRYEQVLDSGVSALRFDSALPAGEVTVSLDYTADFDQNLAGLFRVEEQGDAYALAKSESIQARRFLPGFDEPGMKAVFTMKLRIPAGYEVITNTPEQQRSADDEGFETVTFAPTRPMSTYLLSLAVGPFDVVERPPLRANAWREHAVPLRGFARRGRGGDLKYILDITPDMMEVFESQLQQPYPYKKLDIIAAPQWPSGATELSAAITYREQRILVGDDPAPGARLALVNVHAHEIAHMWFGNLVTPPWWDDLWLKEGFATWGTPLAMTLLEPDGGHDVSAAASAIEAMRLDSLVSTRAIREPILDNDNVRNAYDAITYRKSLGVIHMVDQYFGPEIFRPALGRYIASFTDASADSPQFYDVIGRETKTPALTETFRSFVEQKGIPLLRTELKCDDTGVRVSVAQERYRAIGSAIAAADTRWTIPVCLRTATGERHCELLRQPSAEMQLNNAACPAWVLPNAGGAGYFRWQLPPAQWTALLSDFSVLTPTEALSLVDSAIATFEAGLFPANLLLDVIKASAASPYRQVVSAPLSALSRYARDYFDAQQREALAARVGPWYATALDRASSADDADMQLLATRLTGFMAQTLRLIPQRETLAASAAAFTGFEQEPEYSALSSDLYEAALTVAVQDLGEPFLRHLIGVRTEIDDPKFDSAAASAIGRADSPDTLPLVYEQALSESMGSRETYGLLSSATATPAVAAANWGWVQDNFPAVIDKIPDQWRRLTPSLASTFCSEAQLLSLQQLFKTHAELAPGYERALNQTVERIQLCDALRGQGEALAAAL